MLDRMSALLWESESRDSALWIFGFALFFLLILMWKLGVVTGEAFLQMFLFVFPDFTTVFHFCHPLPSFVLEFRKLVLQHSAYLQYGAT